jgi:predicted lipoprotein with Yx(FWY)xxD motif
VPGYGSAGPTATAGSNSSPTLQVAMNATLHQNIVVDSTGKTVYIFVPDGSSTTSKVPAALQALWPAVSAPSSTTPSVGAGLSANKLTVNGARQVAYGGHLLYTYKGDARAGVANGQGLAKIWYVISPAGTPITT